MDVIVLCMYDDYEIYFRYIFLCLPGLQSTNKILPM